ncbi:MAG: N-acetylmuramoyl-L-alanine amidase [Fibrella sp.]|nr:N-acetylmuramoyl-L-alanine amidase [Armatimonadota bacterium]
MALLKDEWLPNASMKRVITHWTVGKHKASDFEREHYHFLVEWDGTVVRGDRSILDNAKTSDGVYAAHTFHCNQGSIGIAACCMLGTNERPFRPGNFPLTEAQYLVMASVVAELCRAYDIPVTPQTVLGHGEVQVNLGIRQRGKWDPMVLPWDPNLSFSQVGNYFRSLVTRALEGKPNDEEEVDEGNTPLLVKARVLGETFTDAILEDGSSYVKIRSVATKLGWQIPKATDEEVTLQIGDGEKQKLPMKLVRGRGYVSARDLAELLGKEPSWDKATRTVIIE